MEAFKLKIFGRVQGVFYRQSAVTKALSLKLRGQVKNCPDGSVELIAQGEIPSLNLMIDWCKEGPPGAIVEKIEIQKVEPKMKYYTFQISHV